MIHVQGKRRGGNILRVDIVAVATTIMLLVVPKSNTECWWPLGYYYYYIYIALFGLCSYII